MALPTLRQLQYLVSLHEHQHFGRAAFACHVTQSTLSAGLRELEAVLGARLVERTRRATVFTPLGVRTVFRAQDLLQRARALADLSQAAPPPLRRLRLGVIPTVAPFLLHKLLPGLRRLYPDLEIVLHEEMSHVGCEALARDARDCVLLALPYAYGELDSAILFEDPILAAFPAGQAPLGQWVDPADLPPGRLLLLDEGHCLRDQALAVCGRPDLDGRALHGGSLHTLVRLVDAGLGVTLLPNMALEAGVADQTSIEIRALAVPNASRTIVLAWRRNSARAEEFAVLAARIREIQADFARTGGFTFAAPDLPLHTAAA
jgi:LysR family hydrogen peroxide-inducible transcriptional activator